MAKGSAAKSALTSMTGFGKANLRRSGVEIRVEIRAVNHRYLDFVARVPRLYADLEHEIRALVAGEVRRGRVELTISRESAAEGRIASALDPKAFEALFKTYLGLCRKQGLLRSLDEGELREAKLRMALEALRRSELSSSEDERDVTAAERALLFEAVKKALGSFCIMRRKEGAHLARDMERRLRWLSGLRSEIERRAAKSAASTRARLLSRIGKLGPEIALDPARLAAEVALLADKADVTEELVRMESHLSQFKAACRAAGNGRKLDFIAQELGRELNTIASKAQDAGIHSVVVEGKVELEKLREQIQNIE